MTELMWDNSRETLDDGTEMTTPQLEMVERVVPDEEDDTEDMES